MEVDRRASYCNGALYEYAVRTQEGSDFWVGYYTTSQCDNSNCVGQITLADGTLHFTYDAANHGTGERAH